MSTFLNEDHQVPPAPSGGSPSSTRTSTSVASSSPNTTTPTTSSSIVVVVDYWENQKYRAFQGGWIATGSSHASYSNLHGKGSVEVQKLTSNEKYCLPYGWEWIQTEWKPDLTSQIFGHCDNDGWSYASTWEQLIKDTQEKQLKGDMTSSSNYRRRRWTRTRRCIDPEIIKGERLKRDYMTSCTSKLHKLADFRYKTLELIQDYDSKWRNKTVDLILSTADSIFLEVLQSMEYIIEKLTAFTTFLKDNGAVEMAYALKLREFANRWIDAGNGSSGNAPKSASKNQAKSFVQELKDAIALYQQTVDYSDKESDTSSGAQSPVRGGEGQQQGGGSGKDTGFFHLVSSNNLSVVEHKIKFATLLLEHLPKGKE